VQTYWKNWIGPQIERQVHEAGRRGLWAGGHVLLGEAVQEVPLDKGPLMNSGMVVLHATELEACVCFGGGPGTGKPELKYAIRWHENNANFQHGRKMRYLADPLMRTMPWALMHAVGTEIGKVLQ